MHTFYNISHSSIKGMNIEVQTVSMSCMIIQINSPGGVFKNAQHWPKPAPIEISGSFTIDGSRVRPTRRILENPNL